MVEVTDADRERAEEWRWALLDPMAISPAEDSQIDVDGLSEAFAHHRIAAEQRGKLEGARLALEAAAKACETETDYTTVTPFVHRERLVSAIRALSPAKIVGDG